MSSRGDLLRIRAQFEATQAKQEKRLNRFLALMGDGEGNLAVPGTPLFVYVRVLGRGVVECLNQVAPLRNDLPIIVGYDFKKPDTLQVLSIYEGGMSSFGPYAYLPPHHQAHEFQNADGGDDVVWIQKQAVIPLLCHPTSPASMFVVVLEDNYPWLSGWNLFPGTTSADLTARVPGLGDARFVLIYVDGATNALGYLNGATFAIGWPPGTAFSLVPAPPAGSVPVAAVYLPNGIAAIGWLNLYDLRLFNQPMGGSVTPAAHALLDTTVHSDTATGIPLQGDIMVGNATPLWARLARGAANLILKMNAGGTDPEWGEPPIASISGYIRGAIFRGGAADWEVYALAGAAGYALVSTATDIVWDQTPAWTGEHSFVAGIAFTGASGANEITVPDNTAIALELLDAGGLEYMRVVSTDANPYLLIDPAATGFFVGVGIAAPVAHLDVYDATVSTTVTYYGGRFDHIKTAGVTDTADRLYGLMGNVEFNQGGGIIGHVDGLSGQVVMTAGEIGQSGTVRHLRGLICSTTHAGGTTWGDVLGAYLVVDANAGTIGRDVFGCNITVDIEAAMTSIGQNVYGLRIWMDVDQDPVGTVYGVYLTEGSNQDYGFYQSGLADNYLGGRLGINVTAPLAMAHLDQSSTSAAIPVIILDQADVSDGFINFIGSDRGIILSDADSLRSVRVEWNGTVYRLALYVDA